MTLATWQWQDESKERHVGRVLKFTFALSLHAVLVLIVVWIMPAQINTPPKPVPIRLVMRTIEVAVPAASAAASASAAPKPVTELPRPLKPAARPGFRRPAPVAAPPVPITAAAPAIESVPAALTASPQPPVSPKVVESPAAPVPDLVTAARFDADYLQNPAPAYPPMSRKLNEEGKVLLEVKVTAAGIAEHVQIKQGSGYPRLDEAALNTVRQWRFMPARRGEAAVAASVVVPIVFRLDS